MRKILAMCVVLCVLSGCVEAVVTYGPTMLLIPEVQRLVNTALAQQAPVYIDPTIPGGSGIRDYSRPSLVIQGGQVQQTCPGTYITDPTRGGWVVQPGQADINLLPDRRNSWTTDLND